MITSGLIAAMIMEHAIYGLIVVSLFPFLAWYLNHSDEGRKKSGGRTRRNS